MDFSLQSVPPDGTVECAKVPKDDCIPEQCQHSSTRAYWSDVIGESVEDNRGNESGGEEKGRKRRGGEGEEKEGRRRQESRGDERGGGDLSQLYTEYSQATPTSHSH